MDFRPLQEKERYDLLRALRKNADENVALLTGRDTSFIGSGDVQEITDEEVIFAVKSVPTHY